MKNAVTILILCALFVSCASFCQPRALASGAEVAPSATLTLIGHASVKIKTSSGAVIYIDPYHPGDYSEGADLILVSHEHSDHNKVALVTQNEGCLLLRTRQTINPDGSYNMFEHMGVTVEPFPAANKNHKRDQINGYLLGFDGLVVYFASDTDKISEMESLAPRNVDYALLPIDGQYNMGAQEAMQCAALIGARHNIPMHFFSADPAAFRPENLLFIPYGESVALGGE